MDFFRSRAKSLAENSTGMAKNRTKLLEFPTELRLRIFDYILQDVFLHVTPLPGEYAYARWTYLRCRERMNELGCHWAVCCPYHQNPAGWYSQWDNLMRLEPALMSLLLSCRNVYAEFVGLLYSRALFDFCNLEDYLDFVRYAPSTARQLRHMRTRHIDIDGPFLRGVDGHIQTQKDRIFVEAVQRMFLHTPRLESLRLIIESTALWERKSQHQRGARWARMIVDLATLRRQMNCGAEPSGSGDRASSIVRFKIAISPEAIVQTAPWPVFARFSNFARPPRLDESPDLDRTLSWLLDEVMGNGKRILDVNETST